MKNEGLSAQAVKPVTPPTVAEKKRERENQAMNEGKKKRKKEKSKQ